MNRRSSERESRCEESFAVVKIWKSDPAPARKKKELDPGMRIEQEPQPLLTRIIHLINVFKHQRTSLKEYVHDKEISPLKKS
jgi:hypothetical protein